MGKWGDTKCKPNPEVLVILEVDASGGLRQVLSYGGVVGVPCYRRACRVSAVCKGWILHVDLYSKSYKFLFFCLC